MKSFSTLLVAAFLIASTTYAHDSDEYTLLVPKMQESPIDTISQQADDVPDQATVADQSALKVIDRLTEKLYLERRKRWKLD